MIPVLRLIFIFAAALLATVGTASAQQVLRVGLQDSEPGVIRNGNQMGGRDIDIWDAIAKNSGLRVTYAFRDNGPQLLVALDAGEIDVAGWAVSRTPATESKYLLTDTIFPSAEALLVPSTDTRVYRSLDDIKTLKFATLKGTAYADYLKKNGIADIRELDTVSEVLKAMAAGESNAALFSGIIAGYMSKQGKLGDLRLVSSYQPALTRPILAAFPKTAMEAYTRANASLRNLHTDGTMANIKAKYGM